MFWCINLFPSNRICFWLFFFFFFCVYFVVVLESVCVFLVISSLTTYYIQLRELPVFRTILNSSHCPPPAYSLCTEVTVWEFRAVILIQKTYIHFIAQKLTHFTGKDLLSLCNLTIPRTGIFCIEVWVKRIFLWGMEGLSAREKNFPVRTLRIGFLCYSLQLTWVQRRGFIGWVFAFL